VGKLAELTNELQIHLKAARDIAAKAEAEGRDFTDAERVEVDEKLAKAREVKGRIQTAKGDDEMRKAIADLGEGVGIVEPADKPQASGLTVARKGQSIGEAFIQSPEYKAFMAQFPGGNIPAKARVQSNPVQFKALFTGTDDNSAGAFVQTDFTGIYEGLGRRPLTIRDIISVRQTGSDTVEYVRQLTRVNAAAPVAEATTAAGPTANTSTGVLSLPAGSGVKPEGGMTWEKVTATVKTIAEWVPATKRALSDASQLRGLIDQELRDDIREEEEDQILTGDGMGENLTGILETSGTQSQAWATDMFTTTRQARRKVQTVGRAVPTAYVMNPEDWEKFDLAREGSGTGQFLGAGPFTMTTPRLWGLPVIESEAMPVGTAVVGDFRKAVLWDREQVNVSITDSHADFFIRNLIAVLAEERVAFGVIRPSAFVEIDLTA
jgi:HK97 family phage major capsid protein